MKFAVVILASILGPAALLLGQSATQPTTAPATQPAEAPRVLLLSFGEITDGPSHAWIGRAIQQSVLADLSRIPGIRPVVYLNSKDENRVMDPVDAIKAGRDMEADYLIFGSYQVVGNDLRITGQIFDSATAEPIAGLKASGTISQLFAMEDTLGAQIRSALLSQIAGTDVPQILRGGQPMPEIVATGPVRTGTAYEGSGLDQSLNSREPYWSYYYKTYPSYYYAPNRYYYRPTYYSYPYNRYPYYGGSTVFFFSNNFDDKHRFHGHGRDHGKGKGGFGGKNDFDDKGRFGSSGRFNGRGSGGAVRPPRSERIGPNTNYIRGPRMSIERPQRNYATPPGQGGRAK